MLDHIYYLAVCLYIYIAFSGVRMVAHLTAHLTLCGEVQHMLL